jgi:uncharacterized protein YxjI
MSAEAIISALGLVGMAALGFLNLKVRAELSNWKADAYRHRDTDREELRNWINGSFLRSKEAIIQMDAFSRRLDSIERRIEDIRREHKADKL